MLKALSKQLTTPFLSFSHTSVQCDFANKKKQNSVCILVMSNLPPKPDFDFGSPSRPPPDHRPYHRPPPPGNDDSPDHSWRNPSSSYPPRSPPPRSRQAGDSYVAPRQGDSYVASYQRGWEPRHRDTYGRERDRSPPRERNWDPRDRGPPADNRYRGPDYGRDRDGWRDRERERDRDEDLRRWELDSRSRGPVRDRFDRNRPRERDWRTRDDERRYGRGPPDSDRSWAHRESRSPSRHIRMFSSVLLLSCDVNLLGLSSRASFISLCAFAIDPR